MGDVIGLEKYVSRVTDFPSQGITFLDISPLLGHHFQETVCALDGKLTDNEWEDVDAVAGIESRGFILAAALAHHRKKGFVPIRKGGKLPPPVLACDYQLEYGQDCLEIHRGEGNVVIVDDVLATGGTIEAAARLSKIAGFSVSQAVVLIDLEFVKKTVSLNCEVRSVIRA